MTKNKNRIFLITCISFLIVFVVVGLIIRRQIYKNHEVVSATITKCYWGGPKTSRYIVEANFIISGKVYTPTWPLSCRKLKLDSLKARLIGLKVPAIYLTGTPSISTVLLEKETYLRYNVSIPDTLRWLPEFLECK